MINIFKCIEYYRNPKYRIMKGIQIQNRAIMFLGANPRPPKDKARLIETHGYVDDSIQSLKISFKNQNDTYWKSNMYCRIWTFKGLIKWARILPKNGNAVLELKYGKWNKIKEDKKCTK